MILRGPLIPGDEAVLSPSALDFVAKLERAFRGERESCLADRVARQARLDRGERPTFCDETKSIRESDWIVAAPPDDLLDRRVEITGPTDRKMIINALNSGAKVFMADFEDALTPTWRNVIDGQMNLFDAVRRAITFTAHDTGREYKLIDVPATLMVRPRGWHLPENHVLVDGKPVSAGLFDFALYFFHNAKALVERGSGPYFYLPKLEGRREARLWNQVFRTAQDLLGIRRGTIRATVLIETILAAFEMDEILWELREHSAGLNCGRWDYIFSFIKKFRTDPNFVLPDRGQITMDQGFLRAYSLLLIETCHKRRAHAIGGMAAQIPIKSDADRNRVALEKVRADKRREATDGHDGTWVAHPGLVTLAAAEFDAVMPGKNQIHRRRDDASASAADLLRVPRGTITEKGVRENVRVVIQYFDAWLRGQGCVPLNDLMEDAATAEIARTQLWQWRRHGAKLDNGRVVDAALVNRIIDQVAYALCALCGANAEDPTFIAAVDLLRVAVAANPPPEFMTLAAYELITSPDPKRSL